MKINKAETISPKGKCNHPNGWFGSVYFKKWFFKFRKTYFFCTDCRSAIDVIIEKV